MADELKSQTDLKLDVPPGLNAHLLVESHNPPKKDKPIARVGYWLSTDPAGEVGENVCFDVDGDLAAAQAVINSKVAPALKELAPKRTEEEAEADKELADAKRATAAAEAKAAAAAKTAAAKK